MTGFEETFSSLQSAVRLGALPDLRQKFWAVRDRLTAALDGALDTPEKDNLLHLESSLAV